MSLFGQFFSNEGAGGFTEMLKTEAAKKIIEKLTTLIADSAGQEVALDWLQKIDFKPLLIAEAIVIVIMIIFRSYILSSNHGFWSHLIAEVWTLAVYVCLSLFFVPLFIFGSKYYEMLKFIFNTFISK